MSNPNRFRSHWFSLFCFASIYFEYFFGKVNSYHSTGTAEEDWGGLCSSGKAQSPINFRKNETKIVENMEPLNFSGLSQKPSKTIINHSGDTIRVLLKTAKPITVTGGVFKNQVYKFQQLHFHWGKNTREGSEHTIESRRFPVECHLVFQKVKPKTKAKSFAVLGVHYEADEVGSKVLDPIVKSVTAIARVRKYVAKAKGYPLKQYLPKDVETYFSYTGSLTTPPCTEGIIWIWFADTLKASPHQDNALHRITDGSGHKVDANFRGTQPLNGRTVYLVNPW